MNECRRTRTRANGRRLLRLCHVLKRVPVGGSLSTRSRTTMMGRGFPVRRIPRTTNSAYAPSPSSPWTRPVPEEARQILDGPKRTWQRSLPRRPSSSATGIDRISRIPRHIGSAAQNPDAISPLASTTDLHGRCDRRARASVLTPPRQVERLATTDGVHPPSSATSHPQRCRSSQSPSQHDHFLSVSLGVAMPWKEPCSLQQTIRSPIHASPFGRSSCLRASLPAKALTRSPTEKAPLPAIGDLDRVLRRHAPSLAGAGGRDTGVARAPARPLTQLPSPVPACASNATRS